MRRILCIGFLMLVSHLSFSQASQKETVKTIYDSALAKGKSYFMLEHLATKIGARLSGSDGAVRAVEWAREVMKDFADTVWLQPVMVPHWVRGKQETARVIRSGKNPAIDLNICALGGSVSTGPEGIKGAGCGSEKFR
jgi:carboxypeptidase Q